MADEVFISYSRRNQDFVKRLAAELDQRVSGVWFDQSDIAPGEEWRQSLIRGIEGCKVFVLIVSPQSAKSKEVLWELDMARKAGKRVIPVIYTTTRMPRELAEYLHTIQYIDLREGLYEENFELLIDGLITGGVTPKGSAPKRDFLRNPAKIPTGTVLKRVPGWGCSWGLGWGAFAAILMTVLLFAIASDSSSDIGETFLFSLGSIAVIGGGGVIGGLVAGGMTMSALRGIAPAISWQHMKPSIGIWAAAGPAGMLVSIGITWLLSAVGILTETETEVDCSNLGFGECLSQSFVAGLGDALNFLALLCMVALLLMAGIWFVTGLLAGRWAVRRIRLMEPQITDVQSRKVSVGWGCGAVVSVLAMFGILMLLIAIGNAL